MTGPVQAWRAVIMTAKAERENIIAKRFRARCAECRTLGVRRLTVEAAQRDADRHNRTHHPVPAVVTTAVASAPEGLAFDHDTVVKDIDRLHLTEGSAS